VPAGPPVPRNRDAERARNTACLWVGLTVLFAGIAVLQWLAADDLWSTLLHTAAAVAYAGAARGARREARKAAERAEAGGAETRA
jgi:hypothetical protein